MDLPLRDTHLESAQALYRQRLGWLALPCVSMQAMLDLEHRLRVHLHVLSRCTDPGAESPDEAPALFVDLAARLCAPDDAVRREAVALGCGKLEQPGPPADAARDALALYAQANAEEALQATFRDAPEARAAVLEILWAQGMALPSRFFEPATLTALPPEVHAAALRHAARNGEAKLAVFQPYYLLVAFDDGADRTPAEVLQAALWGGLLRGDPDAPDAARAALGHENDPAARGALLRLLALVGDPDAVGLLEAHMDYDSEQALHLLALHGTRRAVDVIVGALDDPRHAQAAAEAWRLVSGETLPRRPRLSVVGGPSGESNVGELPEPGPARAAWRLKAPGLRASDRWHGGERLTPRLLVDRLLQEAGAGSVDRLDLLCALLGRPVGLYPAGWHGARAAALRGLDHAPDMSSGPIHGAQARA
jgi:hypothetical protein